MTINELREITGLSQSAFADRYHLNKYTLQGWEQGQRECPEAVLELVKDAMGFNEPLHGTRYGIKNINYWVEHYKDEIMNILLRKEGYSLNERRLAVVNGKTDLSCIYSPDDFVNMMQDRFFEDLNDGYDPEWDDLKDFEKYYLCGFKNFNDLRSALKTGESNYTRKFDCEHMYVNEFNPNRDLALENEEMDFDIPYILEINE